MAPPIVQDGVRLSKPLTANERLRDRHLSWRAQMRRRISIVALSVALAALMVGLSMTVGTHLVSAWWLGSLGCAVDWEIDASNWRHVGVTSVSHARFTLNRKLSDRDLKYVRNLHRVISVSLPASDEITDKGLKDLSGLDLLTELNLERLDRFRHARFGVNSAPLTDACLVHLQALPRLEILTLAGNLITDQGLTEIAKMPRLKVLDLNATEISDAGLVNIERMRNLETINLGATRVTKAGVANLRMTRPDLSIELDTDPVVEEAVKIHRGVSR
jgi:hypothetical protein